MHKVPQGRQGNEATPIIKKEKRISRRDLFLNIHNLEQGLLQEFPGTLFPEIYVEDKENTSQM